MATQEMKVLVTGGAGYIGSHTVSMLQKKGYQVTVFDNLIFGHREAISCPLIVGDLLNKAQIEAVFAKEKYDAVIHFAALSAAGESMEKPARYFKNNILGSLNLVEAMRQFEVKQIIFSSTAAVYGHPEQLPLKEDALKEPVSVYGESKLAIEKILFWYDQIYEIKNICLRYFNACGAALDGLIGEDHRPETHLIPLAIKTALGKRDTLSLFGDDYPTPDGTCIRDYIHVLDLASAHIMALEYLEKVMTSDVFNVGTGQSYSNQEVVAMVKKVSQKDFSVIIGPRRIGDPAMIYADNQKIKKSLSWEPRHSDLKTIVETAWRWHQGHPRGYSG